MRWGSNIDAQVLFESLDRNIRDIMRFDNPSSFNFPFEGKTIVFYGDFWQILPFIPKSSRHDIVHVSTISSWYLWRHCTWITKNTRLCNLTSDKEGVEIKRFSYWIANIRDEKIKESNDVYATIDIPDEFLIKYFKHPIATIRGGRRVG